MDNTAPTDNQLPPVAAGSNAVSQPSPQQVAPLQPLQPQPGSAGPISIPQKEQAPTIAYASTIEQGLGEAMPQANIVEPSNGEKPLHPEVAEAGVEKIPEVAPLSPDAQKVGVRLAKEAVPVQTTPSGSVVLPMTEEEAKKAMKTQKNLTDSFTWYVTLIWRECKKIHAKIKGG